MEKKYLNPDTLLKPRGYTHIVTITGPAKMIFISGQVAIDKEGKLVGPGDLKTQIRQASANLKAALEGGLTFEDILRTLEQHGTRATPPAVVDLLRTWSNKRERISIYPSAALLEFAERLGPYLDVADRED